MMNATKINGDSRALLSKGPTFSTIKMWHDVKLWCQYNYTLLNYCVTYNY